MDQAYVNTLKKLIADMNEVLASLPEEMKESQEPQNEEEQGIADMLPELPQEQEEVISPRDMMKPKAARVVIAEVLKKPEVKAFKGRVR